MTSFDCLPKDNRPGVITIKYIYNLPGPLPLKVGFLKIKNKKIKRKKMRKIGGIDITTFLDDKTSTTTTTDCFCLEIKDAADEELPWPGFLFEEFVKVY